ncbi:cytochrome P450 [Peredibacter starrii]|uniref:Cytochrome P450 n=1 Tax=Peredibacter starrii TaxID=28202 RepID=A0AAX4HJT1_9BACT|nr:cytochrome P450 [Peredibacter starrii]WPU63473.1 cytochrome P450 [Peredibacter starrii]
MNELKKVSNLSLLRGVWKHHSNLVEYIEGLRKENGEAFYFSFGSLNGFFLNRPDLVKTVMMERWATYPKSARYKTLSPLIGDSILTSNGDRWKERRVLAQPIFQTKIIAGYREVVEKEVDLSLSMVKSGEVIDAYSHVAQFTFRVISKIMFSDDIDEVFEEFHETVLRIQNECTVVALYPFEFMDNLPLPANITFKKLSGIIHRIVDGIIEKRLKNPDKDSYKDLLSRYLKQIDAENKNFSLTELRNELVTMLIAGNETTALSISWALYELARHENHQERLIDEVKGLSMPSGEENAFQFLKQVPFMSSVINEIFRMYPAVWLFSRQAAKDDELDSIKVKKDSLVLISPYFLHRNAEFWNDPNTFDPPRFERPYNEDAFIPFAKGPRMCIGMSLAQFEIQQYLFQFFKKFKVTPGCDLSQIRPKPLVNLYPNAPIKLMVTSL